MPTPLLRGTIAFHHTATLRAVRRPALLAIVLAVLPVASAGAADFQKSRHLWATVNVCDTERNPDTLGIRASMPGSGRRRESMWMRFRAQYYSEGEGLWHNFVAKGADSGPVRVGQIGRAHV